MHITTPLLLTSKYFGWRERNLSFRGVYELSKGEKRENKKTEKSALIEFNLGRYLFIYHVAPLAHKQFTK